MAETLQDQGARQAITDDLHQNMMVLAGAGAGKTHALVGRMAAWICTGQGEAEDLAAITFTRKAAGEMRARFAARLHEAAGQGDQEAERARRALTKLDRCFVGTIHSFCGQLLRERPLEAGLPADFGELEAREEGRLRRVVWDRFVQQGHLRGDEGWRQVEEMTLQAGQPGMVRLMNLHQAKGLQARVVCLADPCDTSAGRHQVEFHVSRTGPRPFLSMRVTRPRGPHAMEVIGEPAGWEEDAREEDRFLGAEELRLLYVAATRACDLLVVSCYEGKTDAGPWAALYPALEQVPPLPNYDPPRPARAPSATWDLAALARQRQERRASVQQPSYQIPPRLGEGTGYGALVHRVLGAAVEGRLPDDPGVYLEFMLEEAGLPRSWRLKLEQVLQTFRTSALWAQVQAAAAVHTQVEFAAPAGPDLGVRGVIDLIFRVAGGWKMVDYQSETTAVGAVLEAGVRVWQELAGELVVERGVWHTETGVWQEF